MFPGERGSVRRSGGVAATDCAGVGVAATAGGETRDLMHRNGARIFRRRTLSHGTVRRKKQKNLT